MFLSLTWYAKDRKISTAMRVSEYLKLKQRIEADYRKKLDALELVWKMSDAVNGKLGSQTAPLLQGRTKGRLVRAVREFIQKATSEFAISDIQTALLRDHSELGEVRRQSIATALRRQKGIEIVSAGKGRTEAKYRKVLQARREGV